MENKKDHRETKVSRSCIRNSAKWEAGGLSMRIQTRRYIKELKRCNCLECQEGLKRCLG